MRFLALLAILYGFTGCFQKPAKGGPDLEYTYGTLLVPRLQSALPVDCLVSGMRVDRFGSKTMVSCNGTNYSITASMHPFAPPGRCVDTTHFRVCVTPDAPVLANTFADLLSATPQIERLAPAQFPALRLLGLWVGLMAVMLVLILLALGRIIFNSPRRDMLIMLGLFILALVLRLAFGLWAPIHANGHGIAEAEGVIRGVPVFLEGLSKGPLWYFFTAGILRLGLAGYQGLFVVNAILSAFAVVFLFMAVRHLCKRTMPAVLSALVPATFPGLVVLSSTEAPQNFVIFIAAIAILFGTRFYRTKNIKDLLAGLGSMIIGAALFFESAVLLLPAIVLLWGGGKENPLTIRQKTGFTFLGLFLWLPQAIFLAFSAGKTDFLSRLLQAFHTLFGLWNIYPVAFWVLVAYLVFGLFFIRRPMALFLLSFLFAGLVMAGLTLGASGWTTDPIRYQSEAIFFAMPLVMLASTRMKGLLAVILAGIFIWTLFQTPLPDTIEQKEFRFLQASASSIPGKYVIIPPRFHPQTARGPICAFPAAIFYAHNPVFRGQVPANMAAAAYYGPCQAARGVRVPPGRKWLVHTEIKPGKFRYGVSYPAQVDVGFYLVKP